MNNSYKTIEKHKVIYFCFDSNCCAVATANLLKCIWHVWFPALLWYRNVEKWLLTVSFSVLFLFLHFPIIQRPLEQHLWSSIFPRGPFRFSVHQFLSRLSLLVSSHQQIIRLPPQLLPLLLPLLALKRGKPRRWILLFFFFYISNHKWIPLVSNRPQDWPQAMKEYVQRCFTACETEEDKDRTEKVLKEILQDRLKDGSAYTIDWTREPLPE